MESEAPSTIKAESGSTWILRTSWRCVSYSVESACKRYKNWRGFHKRASLVETFQVLKWLKNHIQLDWMNKTWKVAHERHRRPNNEGKARLISASAVSEMFPFSAGLFSCLKYKWPHWSQPHMVGLYYNSTRRSHMPSSFPASHLNAHTHRGHITTNICSLPHTHICMHNIYNLQMSRLYVDLWNSSCRVCGSYSDWWRLQRWVVSGPGRSRWQKMKIHDLYLSNCELSKLNAAPTGNLQFIHTKKSLM